MGWDLLSIPILVGQWIVKRWSPRNGGYMTVNYWQYWQEVLSTAWRETRYPFRFSTKAVAALVTALAPIMIAGLRGGFAGMTSTGTGYFLIALAPVSAAFVLFVCNVIEAQTMIYAAARTRIADLEAVLGKSLELNYDAWRHREKLELREAAFLWCDMQPRTSMPPNVRAWYEGLVGAIQTGELQFLPQHFLDAQPGDIQRRLQQERPTFKTVVTRSHLRTFAKLHGYDPAFLRDSSEAPGAGGAEPLPVRMSGPMPAATGLITAQQ
jgi:hypothetical protein